MPVANNGFRPSKLLGAAALLARQFRTGISKEAVASNSEIRWMAKTMRRMPRIRSLAIQITWVCENGSKSLAKRLRKTHQNSKRTAMLTWASPPVNNHVRRIFGFRRHNLSGAHGWDLDVVASQFNAAKSGNQDRATSSSVPTPDGAAPTSSPEQEERPAPQPFSGGKLVFHRDRVELCGVIICSGPRSRSRQIVLELLGKRQKNGSFVAYSGEDLEAAAKQNGAKGSSGRWIQDLRDDIMESLRNHANIISGHKDVILSGDHGYRFAESLAVHFVDQEPITDISDTGDAGDVPDDDVRNVADVRDDAAAAARREWILRRLAAGTRLKAPDVVKQFDCSVKTAQRDLAALKEAGKIEFVGSSRTGYYVLCKPPKADG
jgi:hypothetical protein